MSPISEPEQETPRSVPHVSSTSVLAALTVPRAGRVYSLDSGWWRGMPVHPVHPSFEVLTYRTPRGEQIQKDQEFLNAPKNKINYGFISELVLGSMHTGTHIDALCHVTCGPRAEWNGGHSSHDYLGDFGALNSDAAALAPIIARGVLLDIARLLGVDHCRAEYAISSAELEAAAKRQKIEVQPGDVVLVRTGSMRLWPDAQALSAAEGAGVSIDGAHWLSQRTPLAVGADNISFECAPSGVDGSPQPVHVHLIQENGIPIIEWVNCEALSADEVYEFLFVCLPLTVTGATGSLVRPVAIA